MHRSDTNSTFYDPNTTDQPFEDGVVRDGHETFWRITCGSGVVHAGCIAQNAPRGPYMLTSGTYAPIRHELDSQ